MLTENISDHKMPTLYQKLSIYCRKSFSITLQNQNADRLTLTPLFLSHFYFALVQLRPSKKYFWQHLQGIKFFKHHLFIPLSSHFGSFASMVCSGCILEKLELFSSFELSPEDSFSSSTLISWKKNKILNLVSMIQICSLI